MPLFFTIEPLGLARREVKSLNNEPPKLNDCPPGFLPKFGRYDYDNNEIIKSGLPSVQSIAGNMNVSPDYLSDMLRTLTGMNTQQHIHAKLVEKAKELLTTTSLSVSEIAYQLGFEHPQSFNKLFKGKVNVSPLEFRHSFN